MTISGRICLAAALIAALAPAGLTAQDVAPPRVGEKVRIVSPMREYAVRGELLELRNDTLYVRRNDASAPVAVPVSRVDRIDVRRRRSEWAGAQRGALFLAPVGLVSGVLMGSIADAVNDTCVGGRCRNEALYGGVAGFAGAAVLGGVIGGVAPGSHWEHTSVTVGASPTPGGLGLSMRIGL